MWCGTWWCVRAGLSSPRMMNDPRVSPCLPPTPRRDSQPCRGPTGSPRPPSANALVRPLLSPFHPPSTPFHHDIPPLSLASPSSSSLALVGFARFLPPPPPFLPARSFYFSFIFPTREPSRCNLHPSCCCCRRPSRLPRATTGVEAGDSPPERTVCQREGNFGKFDRDCKRRYELSCYLFTIKREKRNIDSVRCVIPLISYYKK